MITPLKASRLLINGSLVERFLVLEIELFLHVKG